MSPSRCASRWWRGWPDSRHVQGQCRLRARRRRDRRSDRRRALADRPGRDARQPDDHAAARAVVVPKPHTNPKRVNVTLAVTARSPARAGSRTQPPDRSSSSSPDRHAASTARTTSSRASSSSPASPCSRRRRAHSAKPDDVVLTLTLAGGSKPLGPPVTLTMTSVELTLEIRGARPAAGDPRPLSEADKIKPGAFLAAQDAGNHQTRAMVVVRVVPATFTGALSLPAAARRLCGSRCSQTRCQRPGRSPWRCRTRSTPCTIQPGGRRLFVQGSAVSTPPDSGLQLGLAGGEADGDRWRSRLWQSSSPAASRRGHPCPQSPRSCGWGCGTTRFAATAWMPRAPRSPRTPRSSTTPPRPTTSSGRTRAASTYGSATVECRSQPRQAGSSRRELANPRRRPSRPRQAGHPRGHPHRGDDTPGRVPVTRPHARLRSDGSRPARRIPAFPPGSSAAERSSGRDKANHRSAGAHGGRPSRVPVPGGEWPWRRCPSSAAIRTSAAELRSRSSCSGSRSGETAWSRRRPAKPSGSSTCAS